ncbi:hypothetical protein [Streptomyces sp. T028]|uniref:hypothetical protein n=1 Tax=Streptomyces sp. T028 TaxID=3394379 RepID=UPI003A89B676
MTAQAAAVSAGGVQLVGTPGRPARPDRPRRFEDDARNNAYWARIERIVDAAPPLTDEQRAIIRTAFHTPAEPSASPRSPSSMRTESSPSTTSSGGSKEAA